MVPYLCTPVTVRILGESVRWSNFDLATVVGAEIDVFVKDRVVGVVQVSGGKTEAVDVVLWAKLRDLERNLLKI